MNPHSISPLIERLGLTLLHSLWQGVLVAAALAMALAAFRRSSAALRHLVAFTALGLMAACAGVTFVRLKIEPAPVTASVPAFSAGPETRPEITVAAAGSEGATLAPPSAANAPTAGVETPAAMTHAATAPAVPAHSAVSPTEPWSPRIRGALPWIVALWSAGVVGFSLWRLSGWWRLRQWKHEGTLRPDLPQARLAARLRLRRPVRVMVTARALTPMLVSGFKPVILLPASVLSGLSPAQLEAVLAHELAHLRRWDDWLLLGQAALETLFFYHPAVWWINRVIRREREFAADDIVADALADRAGYARALARVAELCAAAPTPALGATGGGPMITRLHRLLRREEPPPRLAGGSWGVVAALAAAASLFLWPKLPAQTEAVTLTLQPGESIQAALDAAPEGAVLKLAAGTYAGNLLIEKSVTLEGVSEGETVISPTPTLKPGDPEAQALETRLKAAADGPEKKALQKEWQRTVNAPTVRVLHGKVALRRLRLDSIAPPNPDRSAQEAAFVNHSPGDVILEDCRLVGPGTHGVSHLADAGSLEISRCLIAAHWGNGLTVAGGAKRLTVRDSDIRNCHYAGVVIGRGAKDVTIERCLISGAAWHGVRYDDASPLIRHCRIWGNARSGIYASGRTEAVITDNVFWKNEMDGISCWFDNRDRIEGNTFDANLREALAVLGSSEPVIRRNVFANSPVAIMQGRVADADASAQQLTSLVLENNVFWQTPVIVQDETTRHTTLSADWKSRSEDPKLDANGVSALEIGARSPVAAQSPWTLTAGEKAIIPAGESRSYKLWGRPQEVRASILEEERTRQAYSDAQALVQEVAQLDSVEQRDAALAKILDLLKSDDEQSQRAALAALGMVGGVDYDRKPFRDPLRRLIRDHSDTRRARALTVLSFHEPEPADLDLALSLASDTSIAVREALPHALAGLTGKDFTGKAGDILLQQLNEKTYTDIRTPLGAVWGAIVSPALEAKIIELSRSQQDGHYAIYFGLRTLRQKGEPAARRLIELLSENHDTTEALWGLQEGIPDSVKPEACEALIKFFAARLGGRPEALKAIRHCATPASRNSLQSLAAKPNLDAQSRAAIEDILAILQ